MLTSPKDLQKKNFYDAMLKMKSIPGWDIFEEANLLALKSGATIPLINCVWGEASPENIKKIKTFYSAQPFSWFLSTEQNDQALLASGFKGPIASPEMILYLDEYKFQQSPSYIQVKMVKTDKEMDLWSSVASATFGIAADALKTFFEPLIRIAGDIAFLVYYKNVPAATSLVYCDNHVAGIYAMSTKQVFRRKRLGWFAAQACLEIAKQNNASYAVLYASSMGLQLYEKMGFKVSQILQEYFFDLEQAID